MKVHFSNILFHPFARENSLVEKVVSLVTIAALTVFTRGYYLGLLGAVHLAERVTRFNSPQSTDPQPDVDSLEGGSPRVVSADVEKCRRIEEEQSRSLEAIQTLARQGNWALIATHANGGLGFDWWMFPVNRPSQGHGDLYAVGPAELERMKANREFMARYLKGVCLVAKSWGIDGLDAAIDAGCTEKPQERIWRGWDVRLGKMLDSLHEFDQALLAGRIAQKATEQGIASQIREPWVTALIDHSLSQCV